MFGLINSCVCAVDNCSELGVWVNMETSVDCHTILWLASTKAVNLLSGLVGWGTTEYKERGGA